MRSWVKSLLIAPRPTLSFVVLSLSISIAARALQQAPADFSGTWRIDPSKTVTSGRAMSSGAASDASSQGQTATPLNANGGTVTEPRKIKDVPPIYPRAARDRKIAGYVILRGIVGTDGRIAEPKVIMSIPELDQAAIDAVRQWAYRPATRNGEPVTVEITTTVMFAMQGVAPRDPRPVGPMARPGDGRLTGPGFNPAIVTITQNDRTLTLSTVESAGTQVSVYRLDGSDSTYRLLMAGGTSAPAMARSHWEGAKLITTITTDFGTGSPRERTETRYLQAGRMVVDTTQPNSKAGPTRVQQVYDKTGGIAR